MAIDRIAPTVLHPVDKRWFHPLSAIGKHRIGRHHFVKRGFFRAQRVGQERVHIIIDPKPFGVIGDSFHADFPGQTNGHQVS